MCNGTATKLLCQHYLIHWSGPRCPKKCVLPSRRVWLACTCAACDPGHNQARVVRGYAAERDRLCEGIRAAAVEGRTADTRLLERRVGLLTGLQIDDLARTRVAGLDPAVGCRWPGMYEQWVNENLGLPVDWDSLLNNT